MFKKTKLLPTILVLLISSCSTIPQSPTTFDTKNSIISETGQEYVVSAGSQSILYPPDNSKTSILYDNVDQAEIAPSFDHVPYYNPDAIVPGMVSVIYKNGAKIRLDNTRKRIEANDMNNKQIVNNILSGFNLEKANYLTLPSNDEAELDRMQAKVAAKSKTEIPHFLSVQIYKFPPNVDTNLIAEKLYGVVAKYRSWDPNYLQNPIYNTVGLYSAQDEWMSPSNWAYTY